LAQRPKNPQNRIRVKYCSKACQNTPVFGPSSGQSLRWDASVISSYKCYDIRYDTIRYDRLYIYIRSKADVSQLNLSHGTENKGRKHKKEKLKTIIDMLRRNSSGKSPWSSVLKEGKSLWKGFAEKVGFSRQ